MSPMTSEWRGDIDLGSSLPPVPSILLRRNDPIHHARLDQAATLRYLALVDVSRVPLCTIAGPPLEVAIENTRSKSWVLDKLGCTPPRNEASVEDASCWWACGAKQSDLAILLKIQNDDIVAAAASFTEVLLLATADTDNALSSCPPTSASIEVARIEDNLTTPSKTPSFQVSALPLCSKILLHARNASGLCTPPPDDETAFFIPDSIQDLEAASKRRKISSVFEAARQQRRKSTSKGGERVAKAMATLEGSQPQHGKSRPLQAHEQGRAPGGQPPRPLARAASDSVLAHSQGNLLPASRENTANARNRSSLRRVESVRNEKEGSAVTDVNDTFAQNKMALSKVVMAGMRLHGLQQRRKPTMDDPSYSHQRNKPMPMDFVAGSNGEDEYKLIYHQTLKSALLALRTHVDIRIISQDTLREVVDQLLGIFCTDPVTPPMISNSFGPNPFPPQEERDNPFDLPHSSQTNGQETQIVSTPVTKKRKPDVSVDVLPGDTDHG